MCARPTGAGTRALSGSSGGAAHEAERQGCGLPALSHFWAPVLSREAGPVVPEATAAGPALHRAGLGGSEGRVWEGPPPPTLLPAPVSLGYGRAEAAPAAAQPRRELVSPPPRAGSRGTSPAGPGALGPRLTTLVCPPWAAQAPGLHAGVQLLGPALPLTSLWPRPGLPPAPRAPSGRRVLRLRARVGRGQA